MHFQFYYTSAFHKFIKKNLKRYHEYTICYPTQKKHFYSVSGGKKMYDASNCCSNFGNKLYLIFCFIKKKKCPNVCPGKTTQSSISCHVGTLSRPRAPDKRHVVALAETSDLKGHPLVRPLGAAGCLWRDSRRPLSLSPDTHDTAKALLFNVSVVNLRASILLVLAVSSDPVSRDCGCS